MAGQNSILDKIIESQEKQQAAQFNPDQLISNLLKNLSHKEGDILSRRFGLSGKQKETLEQIGQHYNITRERIRQVEMATVKKLKELNQFKHEIESAEQQITRLLKANGGIMEENFLLDELSAMYDQKEQQIQSAKFILTKLMDTKLQPVSQDDILLPGWKLPIVSHDIVKEIVTELVRIIGERNSTLKMEDLLKNFQSSDLFKTKKDQITVLQIGEDESKIENEIYNIINSYLKIARNVDQNILGEWGLSHWNTIKPKRMSDKVYLVLKKIEKPLHFNDITELINKSEFDRKIAYPATIHNELILDDRYVLVGRGIYALKEWGYKNGTVMDIIIDILKNADQPLNKDEVVQAVLDQRIVRKSTIYLALTNKNKIKKTEDGRYAIVEIA